MNKPVKLTKKDACNLIRQYFPGLKLEGGKRDNEAVIFVAQTGPQGLVIKVENDWFTRNGCIRLSISDPDGAGVISMYFDPGTFVRDYSVESAEKEKAAHESRIKWVGDVGLEQAHKQVDQYFEDGGD